MLKPVAALDRAALARVARVAAVALVVALVFVAYGLVDNRWYQIVAINGGSMEPTIHDGDAIVILRPPARLRPGMIVTLQVDRFVVTHRIKSVTPGGEFVTRGDANPTNDDWTGTDVRVVGVCALRLPMLGRLLSGLGPERGASGAYLTARSGLGARVGVTADAGPLAEAPSDLPDPPLGEQAVRAAPEDQPIVTPVEGPADQEEGELAPPNAGEAKPPADSVTPVDPSSDASPAP